MLWYYYQNIYKPYHLTATFGGLGGTGSHSAYAKESYGNVFEPTDFGSGGGLMVDGQTDGAGGGVLNLIATYNIMIDGEIRANGADCDTAGCGGGSGGSIVLRAPVIEGMWSGHTVTHSNHNVVITPLP